MALTVEIPRLQSHRGQPGPVGADVDSTFWCSVAPVVLLENVGGGLPRQGTRVRTAWDAETWRLLFEIEDTLPWATLTGHDAPLWTEEVVEVFIDPVGDLESYFEIEINPLGAIVDVVLRRTANGLRKDFGWHVDGLRSRVVGTATGWAAELSIPFEAIAAPTPQAGTSWRVNLFRIDRPDGSGTDAELSAWSPTGIRNFHRPQSFGTVEFVG